MAKKNISSNEQAVLKSMAKGQFYKSRYNDTAVQWTANTERVIFNLGSAANKVVETYLNFRFVVWNGTDEKPQPFEWYVVKAESTAAPDFSTTTTVESYMKEKRIYMRGFGISYCYKYQPPTQIKVKLFNVELEEDEYLLFVVVPRLTSGAAAMVELYEEEHRELGLD